MKKTMNLLLIICMLAFFSCTQRDRTSNEDSKDIAEEQNEENLDNKMEKDADFAVEAAEDGILEVRLAQLAETNATSSEVKTFAKNILADHNRANEELKALALQKNIALPATMGDRCQRKYDRIADKNGREFDESFSEYMVKDHKDAIDKYKKEAEKGNDPDLRDWASRKVASLEHHLTMAEDLEDMVKRANRASNDK